jgi:hypothetical protein
MVSPVRRRAAVAHLMHRFSVSERRASELVGQLLSGLVDGPVPKQGVIVELLVHYLGHWEPFRTPRTNVAGEFRVAYRFEGALGRFPFRAEVLGGQADFPFIYGESGSVDVRTN